VLYAIVDLTGYGRDVHAHARRLEEVLIRAAASFGVHAHREPAFPGVWCPQGKLGAVGFGVRRWVTMHGASLNVSTYMPHYDLIVPCGIRGRSVTSLERVAGRRVEIDRARLELRRAFGAVFETPLRDAGREESIERGVLACH
jgi:lipoate-protein ligase B